jgi:hypothetical protein
MRLACQERRRPRKEGKQEVVDTIGSTCGTSQEPVAHLLS